MVAIDSDDLVKMEMNSSFSRMHKVHVECHMFRALVAINGDVRPSNTWPIKDRHQVFTRKNGFKEFSKKNPFLNRGIANRVLAKLDSAYFHDIRQYDHPTSDPFALLTFTKGAVQVKVVGAVINIFLRTRH